MTQHLARILILDSSILDEVLEVPDWSDDSPRIRKEFARRAEGGEQLVIPITAIVETGNHVVQCKGDRTGAARRYHRLLCQLVDGDAPWRTFITVWNVDLLARIRDGAGIGRSLIDLFSSQTIGGGDLTISAEAERIKQTTHGLRIDLWSKDAKFRAHWPHGRVVE